MPEIEAAEKNEIGSKERSIGKEIGDNQMQETMKEILMRVDHTLLRQTATWEEIRKICEEGIAFQTASVCIPPCYVKQAKEFVGERLPICTVIGFQTETVPQPSRYLRQRTPFEMERTRSIW